MNLVIACRVLALTYCLTFFTTLARAADIPPLFKALATENHFALVRHALAPGNGDPSNFTVTDCSTQRNLNDAGRSQAVEMGEQLRRYGIGGVSVFSSQWCRCLETADLLGFDSVTENPILNSFYQNQQNKQPQTAELEEWLLAMSLDVPAILVTHQVNITAFTGVYPSSGDMVIVKRNSDATFTVLGVVSTAP